MTMTLEEAQEWLRDRVDDGETCPCCTQFAKVYRRKLTGSIARVLIRMWHENPGDWVFLPALRTRGQDEAIAKHWGLIEPFPDAKREDGSSRVGWWRLTGLGVSFVRNNVRLPKYARIYNGRLLGLDDAETVSIVDALGSQFNYDELMQGV